MGKEKEGRRQVKKTGRRKQKSRRWSRGVGKCIISKNVCARAFK